MTAREQEAGRWWEQALRDLQTARITAENERHEVACFLSQQAAEKSVKALHYLHGERPVLGHALVELIERAGAYIDGLGDLDEPAKLLDGYYIATRYPNGLVGTLTPGEYYGQSDSERAIRAAEEIVSAIRTGLPNSLS